MSEVRRRPVLRRTSAFVTMTRLEIEKAVLEASNDEPFTMPFFLASLLVKELRRQNLKTVTYAGPDFTVTIKLKNPRAEPRSLA
jgi:hypothetical protein